MKMPVVLASFPIRLFASFFLARLSGSPANPMLSAIASPSTIRSQRSKDSPGKLLVPSESKSSVDEEDIENTLAPAGVHLDQGLGGGGRRRFRHTTATMNTTATKRMDSSTMDLCMGSPRRRARKSLPCLPTDRHHHQHHHEESDPSSPLKRAPLRLLPPSAMSTANHVLQEGMQMQIPWDSLSRTAEAAAAAGSAVTSTPPTTTTTTTTATTPTTTTATAAKIPSWLQRWLSVEDQRWLTLEWSNITRRLHTAADPASSRPRRSPCHPTTLTLHQVLIDYENLLFEERAKTFVAPPPRPEWKFPIFEDPEENTMEKEAVESQIEPISSAKAPPIKMVRSPEPRKRRYSSLDELGELWKAQLLLLSPTRKRNRP